MVFSAHGVAPEVYEQAKARSLKAIDATCPLVTKVHHEARGSPPTTTTSCSSATRATRRSSAPPARRPAHIQLVDGPDGVDKVTVRDPAKVVWLSQTTLSVDETMETVARLKTRLPLLQSPPSDDICYATQNRQHVVKEIAPECDVVIVVGSRNSSNSVRLVEVALDAGARAGHLVDYAREIHDEWLDGATTVGVTSGASVPEDLVMEVLDHLAERGFAEVAEVTTAEERLTFSLPQELKRDMKAAAAARRRCEARRLAAAVSDCGWLSARTPRSSGPARVSSGAWLARRHLDLRRGRQLVAGDAQLGQLAGADQHPRLQRADRRLYAVTAPPSALPSLADVVAQRGQPAVELAGQRVHRHRVAGQRLLPPRVGHRAQQRHQRGRGGQHDVAGERVLQQRRVALQRGVEERVGRHEQHHELRRLVERRPVRLGGQRVDVRRAGAGRAGRGGGRGRARRGPPSPPGRPRTAPSRRPPPTARRAAGPPGRGAPRRCRWRR